ncbi:MAG: hypothetical protein AAFO99_12285 [Bacteroidota bacterium]
MAQDLRKMFKEHKEQEKYPMKAGHEERFLERLDRDLPKRRKSSFFMLKIAAFIVVLVSIGIFGYQQLSKNDTVHPSVVDTDNKVQEVKNISLGDLSPDLKKVEHYYVANINLALSQLEVSEDNKALVDSFMDRLGELNTEYEKLNTELNEIGPNDQTITALIKNLQLRLQLLQKLRDTLNELKSSKNEQII